MTLTLSHPWAARCRAVSAMILLGICLAAPAGLIAAGTGASGAVVRIMAVGDSITEGGSSFSNWREPLFERLFTAGYHVEYTGSRKSASRLGDLAHEGYGGKNSAFLLATVPANFARHPADIVLLHAGHNHFAEKKPVPGILADTSGMIAAFRKANPKVVILLAQPIPSAKLPKYSYMPDLHAGLAKLAADQTTAASPVKIVPMGQGFDPATDTVPDQVHPNASGAAKMTDHWFDALVAVLPPPDRAYQPEKVVYQPNGKGDLLLHVFRPPGQNTKPRPAVVFFFGGGWQRGTPLQFYPECQWLAEREFVAISADYRTAFTHGTTPFDAVADAKSAVRFIREHAGKLGVDPDDITAAGASAGGHLAAATALLPGLDAPTDHLQVSCRPNRLVLWYPVLDNGPGGYGSDQVKARHTEFSPFHNVTAGAPPTLVFLGDRDPHLPVARAKEFVEKLKTVNVPAKLIIFPGAGHPIYSWQSPAPPERARILSETLPFLTNPISHP